KVILRLFTEGERLAEPISLSKQRKTIKGKSDSRDFLQQLDTHCIHNIFDVLKQVRYNSKKDVKGRNSLCLS
ncbi:hypothetical protein, partial [Marinilactibacillus psychrotolerans]|uniref:hypothetical protein n=1 Tax=Marinilactibacillus psychrotolerans TaxID=191770 RepID=UPI001C7DAB68